MVGGEEGRPPPEVQVIKREPYPLERMTIEKVEEWGDGIPSIDDTNVTHPEWPPTPVKPIEIPEHKLDVVYVKDESINPTGTIKDRAAWELATLYRDTARGYYLNMRAGNLLKSQLEMKPIPRFVLITAGNEGLAIADRFARHNLPPPKLIVSTDTPPERLEALRKLRADVYMVDLSQRALTAREMLDITDTNLGVGINASFSLVIEPHAIFYDWHAHELFNEEPDQIYGSYGSGRWMENVLYWQDRTKRNATSGRHDPRLRTPAINVTSIAVLGAEPTQRDSEADKLTADFKPFLIFKDDDIGGLKALGSTPDETNVYRVDEEYIKEGHKILTDRGIQTEPSGAAGLGLLLQRADQGLVNPGNKILVVNTGSGIDRLAARTA